MEKARSRLQHAPSDHKSEPIPKTYRNSFAFLTFLAGYFTHLPTLLISMPFWLATIYIATQIDPENIKNIAVPNTYLPLLIVSTIAIFFTSAYVFLNTRRGLLVTILTSMWLFLTLQNVEDSIWFVLLLSIFFMISELVGIVLKRHSRST